MKRYSIEFSGPLYNDVFKIHKVGKTEGYHVWHCDAGDIDNSRRMLVVTLYLNTVEEGGETEFLYQSMRIPPVQGTLVLFPATWTHAHRGNPPLKGNKYIINACEAKLVFVENEAVYEKIIGLEKEIDSLIHIYSFEKINNLNSSKHVI